MGSRYSSAWNSTRCRVRRRDLYLLRLKQTWWCGRYCRRSRKSRRFTTKLNFVPFNKVIPWVKAFFWSLNHDNSINFLWRKAVLHMPTTFRHLACRVLRAFLWNIRTRFQIDFLVEKVYKRKFFYFGRKRVFKPPLFPSEVSGRVAESESEWLILEYRNLTGVFVWYIGGGSGGVFGGSNWYTKIRKIIVSIKVLERWAGPRWAPEVLTFRRLDRNYVSWWPLR